MKPVENVTQAGFFMKTARRSSSSTWMSSVPFKRRLPAQPAPYFLMASIARSLIFGCEVRPR